MHLIPTANKNTAMTVTVLPTQSEPLIMSSLACENLRKLIPSLHAQSGCSLIFIYRYPVPYGGKIGKRYTVKGKTVNGRAPGWFSPSFAIFFRG